MKRRQFLGGLASAWTAWPIMARAQESSPRVGYVYTGSKALVASRLEAISRGLRESGLASPQQVELVVRVTDGDPGLMAPMIGEVLASKVKSTSWGFLWSPAK